MLDHETKAEMVEEDIGLTAIFIHQKECFVQYPYAEYEQRMKSLQVLYDFVRDYQKEICIAINKDFGSRSHNETLTLEIFPSLECIKYAKKHLKSWMMPRKHSISKWFFPSKCWVMPQPKGVVGIISPWNYPLFLVIAPLVAALAAGNRVMLKLSEHTPNCSQLLKEKFAELFVYSKVAVITGDAKLGIKFSELVFDHLFFTGSTAVGKKVYQAASNNLVPVTLELGGKSPAILLENEIKKEFIERILIGKLINSGQTCIAPDYVWIPQGNNEILLNLSRKIIKNKLTNILDSNYCSIINKENYDRIIYLVREAITKGAVWHPLVEPWFSEQDEVYKIAPGLLLNANHTMAVMQQEIFGPVIPVMEYNTFGDILRIMQIIPRPLASYIFSHDKVKQKLMIKNTISGALVINNTIVHAAQESLPFGGIGTSGIGSYRGRYGFDTFSMLKPVFKQSKLDIFSKFYPPIKRWQKLLLKYMLK